MLKIPFYNSTMNKRLLQPLVLASAVALFQLHFLSVAGGEYDLTVEVPAGQIQCYFQSVAEKHKAFELDYQVFFTSHHHFKNCSVCA
jgi:hypothetical protein